MTRLVVALLLVMLVWLQFRLWVGEGSLAEVYSLRKEIAAQKLELEALYRRNAALQAEVDDLKEGLAAIEERARTELGMIKEGETFHQVVEPAKGPSE
jgi:cell division protein FtsB